MHCIFFRLWCVGLWCCGVLCCGVVCCVVVCCVVWCCVVLCCGVLCCVVLCCVVLSVFTCLCCAVLCRGVLCWFLEAVEAARGEGQETWTLQRTRRRKRRSFTLGSKQHKCPGNDVLFHRLISLQQESTIYNCNCFSFRSTQPPFQEEMRVAKGYISRGGYFAIPFNYLIDRGNSNGQFY